MSHVTKYWHRVLAVAAALLLLWVLLVTIEVKTGVWEPLKLIYILSIPLTFGGFIWAWKPAPWARGSDTELSVLRLIVLALISIGITAYVSLTVSVNYKFAIGGTF